VNRHVQLLANGSWRGQRSLTGHAVTLQRGIIIIMAS